MKRSVRLFAVGIIVMLYAASPMDVHIKAQASILKYAYATYSSDTFPVPTVTINAVDPANPGNATVLFTLPVPYHEPPYYLSFRRALPSPNGKWIALIFWAWGAGWSAAEITVVNVVTGEIHNVADYPINLYDDDVSTLDGIKLAAWSPDSHYLAINVFLEDGKILKGGPGSGDADVNKLSNAIFLYSIETNKLINLTAADAPHSWSTWFVWSKDSTQLATATEPSVVSNNDSQITLEIYDIAHRKRQTSILVPNHPNWNWLPTGLCFLTWSPDGRYLSFVMDCDSSAFNYKDVYIAEVASGKITQLTDYKNRLGTPGNDYAGSYPEPVWYDEHTLLVGAVVWQGYGGTTHVEETVTYQWPKGDSITASHEWGTGWVLNPVSREIAYLTETFKSDESSINGSFEVKTLRIDTFNGQTLTQKISLPVSWGQLSWSPDGLTLAYNVDVPTSVTEQGAATYYLWETTFIDKSSGRITRYTPPVDRHTTTRIVGWIVAPEKSNATSTHIF